MSWLAERKAAICKAWLEQSLAAYPDGYANFVRTSGDPFANPVGAIFKEGLAAVLGELLADADDRELRAALAPVIRVRAVQEGPPSRVLAFVPLLKPLIRKAVADGIAKPPGNGVSQPNADALEALSLLDARIDRLVLLAFDIYTECRERIAELRVAEMKRSVAGALSHPGHFAPQ